MRPGTTAQAAADPRETTYQALSDAENDRDAGVNSRDGSRTGVSARIVTELDLDRVQPLAVAMGFEPMEESPPHTLSRRAP